MPCQSSLGPATGFAGVATCQSLFRPSEYSSLLFLAGACSWLLCSGLSSFSTELPVGAFHRQSCFGPVAGFGGVVRCHSMLMPPLAQFANIPGRGLLLSLVGCSLGTPD